ncbi:MAG: transketolase family protein [Oscillospiraceae bacterium]|nr:transketolase family protein [Oscillospiraceae bacterium]
MTALRDSFGQALLALGAEHPDVVVLNADLASATKTSLFAKQFPERHFNCGIAEENMASIAAGLAAGGLSPFISGFAMFTAGRSFEQIRNNIGYPHLNVKICATHGGLSVGEDGASHQCCEDFALMRTIPGMTVVCPCDDAEARAAVRAAYELNGPVYLRFSRSSAPDMHSNPDFPFAIGKAEMLRNGYDVALIANGLMVSRAMEAAGMLAKQGISAAVWNFATIKPLDEDALKEISTTVRCIVTCEEHSIIGGLGEAVAAWIGENHPMPLSRIGVADVFGSSGKAEEVLSAYGLTSDHISEATAKLLHK